MRSFRNARHSTAPHPKYIKNKLLCYNRKVGNDFFIVVTIDAVVIDIPFCAIIKAQTTDIGHLCIARDVKAVILIGFESDMIHIYFYIIMEIKRVAFVFTSIGDDEM